MKKKTITVKQKVKDLESRFNEMSEIMQGLGYAVIIWSPAEMAGVNPSALTSSSIQYGWEFIESMGEHNNNEEAV